MASLTGIACGRSGVRSAAAKSCWHAEPGLASSAASGLQVSATEGPGLGHADRTLRRTGAGGESRDFALRKRLDGGYTLAQRNANITEIVPDSFRYFFDFLPGLVTTWHELRLRVGRRCPVD